MSKSIRLAVLSVLAVSLLPASTPVQVTPSIGVTNSTKNPLQIAILHWYDANQTTTFVVRHVRGSVSPPAMYNTRSSCGELNSGSG